MEVKSGSEMKDSVAFWTKLCVQLVFIFSQTWTSSYSIESAYGCTRADTSTMSLACRGNSVIQISSAVFGRSLPIPDKACDFAHCEGIITSHSDLLLDQKLQCDGQKSCVVDTAQREFTNTGDREDITDYQLLNYRCVSSIPRASSVCFHTSQKITLQCPRDHVILIQDSVLLSTGSEFCEDLGFPFCSVNLQYDSDLLLEQKLACNHHSSCSVDMVRRTCASKIGYHDTDHQLINYICIARDENRIAESSTGASIINLQCPPEMVINIQSTTMGKTYEDKCRGACCEYSSFCKSTVTDVTNPLLGNHKESCDGQWSCNVKRIFHPCDGNIADLQTVYYDCVHNDVETFVYSCLANATTMKLQCPPDHYVSITRSVIGLGHEFCPDDQCCPEDNQCAREVRADEESLWLARMAFICGRNSSCDIDMVSMDCDGEKTDFQYVFYTCAKKEEATTTPKPRSTAKPVTTKRITKVTSRTSAAPRPSTTTDTRQPTRRIINPPSSPPSNDVTEKSTGHTVLSSNIGLTATLVIAMMSWSL